MATYLSDGRPDFGHQTPADGRQMVPAARVVQVPSIEPPAAIEHAWQSTVDPPPHVASQHTPSTQLPLMHSRAEAHAPPRARFDHTRARTRIVIMLGAGSNS
jgi:hypothetical protein